MIALYYYRELSGRENEAFLKHLNSCDKCKTLCESVTNSLEVIPRQSEELNSPSENRIFSDKIKIAIKNIEDIRIVKRRPFLNRDFIYTLSACLLMTIVMHNFILPRQNHDPSSFYDSQVLSSGSAEKVKVLKYRSIYSSKRVADAKESEESIAIINSFKHIAFKDDDEDVQISAVVALGRLSSPFAIESLLDIANNHTNPKVRRAAIACLTNYLETMNAGSSRMIGII
jgi:hypothetical protein